MKHFDFLGCDVQVSLVDKSPEGHREEALAGVSPMENGNVFKIWFKGLVTPQIVAHETWHLYMTILATMDNKEHYFIELNEEIYAYNFHDLYGKVLETVTSMKKYHKLWEQNKKKKGNRRAE